MSPQKNAYKAYTAATRTIAKTKQVVMLYDGAIRFIKQAKTAIAEKRIEDRFNLLVRAADIVVGLQNSIDFANGGEVAHTLHQFYVNMSVRIHSVNLYPKESLALCDGILEDLKQMRDVWENIDRGEVSSDGAADAPSAPAGVAAPSSGETIVTLSA